MDNSNGLIIGAVAGSIGLLVGIMTGVAVLCYYRKRGSNASKKKPQEIDKYVMDDYDDAVLAEQPPQQALRLTNENVVSQDAHHGLNRPRTAATPVYENRPQGEWEYVEADTL